MAPTSEVKERKPSSIELTVMAMYQLQPARKGSPASVKTLAGAVNARVTPEGRVELLADNAPFLNSLFKAPAPGKGLLMVYGVRDSLESVQRWVEKARSAGAELAIAQVEVEVGSIEAGLVDRDLLRTFDQFDPSSRFLPAKEAKTAPRPYPARFVNLRRMKQDLQHQVYATLAGHAKSLDKPLQQASVLELATRPELFDALFELDADFRKQIDVLAIPVADDLENPIRMRQLAYVRPGTKILRVTQGQDRASILLPRWLTDLEYAQKLAAAAPIA
jgi:hypothetical protein